MKILREQKEKLENEIKRLEQEELELRKKRSIYMEYESNDIAGRTKSQEAVDYTTAIKHSSELKANYEAILESAELVSTFNNEQIEIGTKFVIEFEDGYRETCTLVETNVGVSTLDGYMTVYSPVGQAIYHQKVTGQTLKSEAIDKTFKIVEIIPQENQKEELIEQSENEENKTVEEIVEPVQEEKKVAQETTKKIARPKVYFPAEISCFAYRDYQKSLQESNTTDAKKELILLDNLTFNQKQYLYQYLRQLVSRKERAMYEEASACLGQIKKVQAALKKHIIRPQTSSEVELGHQVLLELNKSNQTQILDCELIPKSYGKENENGFLSVRTAIGFFAYHAKMGDTVRIKSMSTTVRVAQFGIQKDNLLFPLSANLSTLTPKEELLVEKRFQELQKSFPKMTISQKALLDYELEKLSDTESSPYQEYLYYLKDQIALGNIEVQTQEELEANGCQVGLGSQVSYMYLKNGKLKCATKELVWNSYTTEDKKDYVEMKSALGASLYGKKEQEKISIPHHGKMLEGHVISISNRPSIKTNHSNLPDVYFQKVKK